tara:strand:- start:212 stop:484 length:273 start_codon:yes stop_codon:yes gene_type:complete
MLCEFMNKSDKYQWELLPYFSTKENQGNLSAKHMYGKFLNYVENEDYVGANLAKNFLYKGSLENKGFQNFLKEASKNQKYSEMQGNFYNS